MITLVLGPGGPIRRVLAEVVPFLVALLVGWPAYVFAGTVAGIAAWLVSFLGVSALLRAVRRRPRLRLAYRLALAAHVLFWSFLGWRGSAPAPASSPGPVEATAWADARAFRAGAADVPFALPAHATLGGWGQPPRRAAVPPYGGLGVLGTPLREAMAVRDPEGRARIPLFNEPEAPGHALSARAVVLVPEGGGATVAFVRLDLISSDAWLAEEVVRRTQDLGVTPATLVLAATHTHSGVGGYAREPLSTLLATDHFAPAVFEAVAAAAAASVRQAVESARPARIAFVRAHDRAEGGGTVLATRRGIREGRPVDDRVIAVRVEHADGTPLAVLLDYAVHPTAVRREHLAFDRDVVGAVEDAVGARLTGRPVVLFLQGALGDVAPRFARSREPGRAMGEAAEKFAAAVNEDLAAGRGLDRLHVRAARVERDLGDPRVVVAAGNRGLLLDEATLSGPFHGGTAAQAFDALALPVNAVVWSLGLSEVRIVGTLQGSAGVLVNLRRQVSRRTFAVGALLLEASSEDGASRARLPVLWVPGEPTQDLGLAWRKRIEVAGDEVPMLVALANGSLGYAVTSEENHAGGYEALATLFGPDTDHVLTEALAAAWSAVRDP